MFNLGADDVAYWVPPTKLSFPSMSICDILNGKEHGRGPSRESTCDEFINEWDESLSTNPSISKEASDDEEASGIRSRAALPVPSPLTLALPPGLDGIEERNSLTRRTLPWLPSRDYAKNATRNVLPWLEPNGSNQMNRSNLQDKGLEVLHGIAIAHGNPSKDARRSRRKLKVQHLQAHQIQDA